MDEIDIRKEIENWREILLIADAFPYPLLLPIQSIGRQSQPIHSEGEAYLKFSEN